MNTFASVLSIFVISFIIIITFLYIKGKIKLMLNPYYAIILGYFVFLNVTNLLPILFPSIILIYPLLLIAISVFFGGFVATFFSKDNKIVFGIIVGIIALIFALVIGFTGEGFVNIKIEELYIVYNTIITLLPASAGGLIAYKCKEFIKTR